MKFGGVDGAFVMEMHYVEDKDEAIRADGMNLLYLGWMDLNAVGGATWMNANKLNGNDGANRGMNAVEHVHGSYADFKRDVIGSGNLGNWAGSWGVDLDNGIVWSILDANLTGSGLGAQQFAAVPEPGTMALLAGALMVVGVPALKRWRKRRAL